MKYEIGVSSGLRSQQILELSEGLIGKFEGRQIVLLLDEIRHKSFLSKLGEQSVPESVSLVLNPKDFGSDSVLGEPLTLPPCYRLSQGSRASLQSARAFKSQRRTLGVMLWEPNPSSLTLARMKER